MKKLFQSHVVLSACIRRMANVARLTATTDEQKAAVNQLHTQADEHVRKVRITGDRFIVVR